MRFFLWFLLTLALPLRAAAPVLLLSADALAANQFSARTMPRLWALSESGRRGEGLPPFPATTFNGHATLATGCWPEHHGVVANSYVDPADGHRVPEAHHVENLLREPLWVAATRSGIPTAVFHWVGATGPWEGVTPWRLAPFSPGNHDGEALAFGEKALQDGAGLVMLYLSGTDEEGHRFGPRSVQVRKKLARLDGELAPWIQRLQARHPGLRVILAADHGMAAMKRRIHLPTVLKGVPATFITHGGSAYVYLRDPADLGRARAALEGRGLRIWTRAEVPSQYHLSGSARVGDLVLLAQEGTWLSSGSSPEEEAREYGGRAGAHAYSSATKAMHTWLVVLGAGRGRLGEVPLWDLAPTVASWLDIHWAQVPDGRPVPGLLEP